MDNQQNTQGGGGSAFYNSGTGGDNKPPFQPSNDGVSKSSGGGSFGADRKDGGAPKNLSFYKDSNEGESGLAGSQNSPFKLTNEKSSSRGNDFSDKKFSSSDSFGSPAISEPKPTGFVNKQAPSFGGGGSEGNRNSGLDSGASLRTMTSDISSIKDSGGGAPSSYKPLQLDEDTGTEKTKAGQSPIRPESFAGGSVFPAPAEQKASFSSTPKKKGEGGKKVFAIVLSLLIVLGAGAAGYFFVFPIFFGKESLSPDSSPSSAITGTSTIKDGNDFGDDVVPPSKPAPTSTSILSNTTTTGRDGGTPNPLPEPAYSSFLTKPADSVFEVSPKTVDIAGIRQAIPFAPSQSTSLKKLVIKDEAGKEALFPRIGPAIAPAIFTGEALDFFEEMVEVLVYENSKGAWPIYILKARENSEVDARLQAEKIEALSVGDLGGFFLKSPGGGNEWKDGSVNGRTARYIAFQESDAALSYLWLDNYLLINTNYAGGQETAKRLGF